MNKLIEVIGLITVVGLIVIGFVFLQVLILQFIWNYLVDYFHSDIRHLDKPAAFFVLVFLWMIGGAFKSSNK